jgi:proline racemase
MAWSPPPNWQRLTTLDAHAEGEPLRIITGGFPDLPGETILAKRAYAKHHHDDLRRVLMWEPRGHADMYGCLLVPPVTPDGDIGVLFMHNEGFSTMCGHGIIALVTAGLEAGLIAPRAAREGATQEVRIDSPAGRVTAFAALAGDRVERVAFRNVPSFLHHRDLVVTVPGLGSVTMDIAFGGAFYAYVNAEPFGLDLSGAEYPQIIEIGMRIKRAVMESYTLVHPAGDPDLNFLYGTILVRRLEGPVHSRNVCVFADGEVDRSPTGTGVSGRAAIHWARGELALGSWIEIESIIGSAFRVRAAEATTIAGVRAIIPEVSGSAHITGRHEFLIDPLDPIRPGFLLR